MDRAKLIKLMMLTASDNDGEALSALRMANRMLAKERVNWQEFLEASAPARPEWQWFGDRPAPRPRRSHRTDASIGPMLADLAQRKHSMSFLMFLSSVTAQWQANGYLTQAQYEAVERAYRRKGGHRGRGPRRGT